MPIVPKVQTPTAAQTHEHVPKESTPIVPAKHVAQPPPSHTSGSGARQLVGYAATGIMFGFALQKGRVYDPTLIQSQLLLTDFTMVKMFLSAVASTQLIVAAAEWAGLRVADGSSVEGVRMKFRNDKECRGLLSVGSGSVLLGAGMALAGACPGTVLAQVGSGVPGSVLTVLGAGIGVAAVTVLDPVLKREFYRVWVPESKDLEHMTGILFKTLTKISSALLVSLVALLEELSPIDSAYVSTQFPSLFDKAWRPWLAGIMIGFTQLLSLMMTSQFVGTSSHFVGLFAPILKPLSSLGLIDPSTELASYNFPSRKWFLSILQVSGLAAGSAISARLGGTWGSSAGLISLGGATAQTVPITLSALGGAAQALIGGFLLLFGARVAKGCTSGHGISGLGRLSTLSLVAVPSMFAGGIATAWILRHLF